jgi:hypothetical protein
VPDDFDAAGVIGEELERGFFNVFSFFKKTRENSF